MAILFEMIVCGAHVNMSLDRRLYGRPSEVYQERSPVDPLARELSGRPVPLSDTERFPVWGGHVALPPKPPLGEDRLVLSPSYYFCGGATSNAK